MRKSQQLARVAGRTGTIAKATVPIAASAAPPPFEGAQPAADVLDLHVGIIRHLGPGFSLGAAFEQIDEPRRLIGAGRRGKLERAIRYLNEEIEHC